MLNILDKFSQMLTTRDQGTEEHHQHPEASLHTTCQIFSLLPKDKHCSDFHQSGLVSFLYFINILNVLFGGRLLLTLSQWNPSSMLQVTGVCFFIPVTYSVVWIYPNLLIHPTVAECSNCLWFFECCCYNIFVFFWSIPVAHIPTSRIVKS